MKDFMLAAQNVNVIRIFVQFFKCEILMSGKFASFIASCTLRIAVEAQGGLSSDADALGITERTTTILNF
jgi:hypothetical protein